VWGAGGGGQRGGGVGRGGDVVAVCGQGDAQRPQQAGHASSDPEAMDELHERWVARGNRHPGDDGYLTCRIRRGAFDAETPGPRSTRAAVVYRPPSCRPARTAGGCGSATAQRPGRSGSSRSTRGRSSYATAGGSCCAATDARRAYRIDRVRGVEVLEDTFSGASPPPRPRTARAPRCRDHPPGRQHQQPGVVRRAARGDPGVVPDREVPRAPGGRARLGQRLLAAGEDPRP
jgi:hypothetical protein